MSGNTLYGTAQYGGSLNYGMVFAINTDGTGFTNLHSFTALSGPSSTNSDGAYPRAGLALSGDSLYGTAEFGGSSGYGTAFLIKTDGTGFTNLHSFTGGSDGAYPWAELILSDNTLYGTTHSGGSSGNGAVFAVRIDGTGFTILHSFTALYGPSATNNDGASPSAGLILSGKALYGTTEFGGSSGYGTAFKVKTDGSDFTNLHSFTGSSDGAYPRAGLLLSGNTLYGTTVLGGSSGGGTVFAIKSNGAGFTNLHFFKALSGPPLTNSDGANPYARMILSGNTLYGTAVLGGSSSGGTLFAVNTNGTGFTSLHNFSAAGGDAGINSDGANPYGGLILSGNTLYGTTYNGGSSGIGTVFSFSFAPQLTLIAAGESVILSWPSKVAGFSYAEYTLQSTPTVTGTFTNIPDATSPYTNPISGAQQFFRLISN